MTEAIGILASVSYSNLNGINGLSDSHPMPDPLPWSHIAGPLATAEVALARLDERLRASPIRDGFVARTHFADACASLWLGGELVDLEDLVLHDCGMDIRAPSHELTRAHAVLRARRRIAAAEPGWALTPAGLDALRGRRPPPRPTEAGPASDAAGFDGDDDPGLPVADDAETDPRDAWAAEMA